MDCADEHEALLWERAEQRSDELRDNLALREFEMNTINEDIARDIAVAVTYLWQGFESAAVVHPQAEYELHADIHGGEIGIIGALWQPACIIERIVNKAVVAGTEFPGVIQYEVYEGLGSWLFDHPAALEYPSNGQFEGHAQSVITTWFERTNTTVG